MGETKFKDQSGSIPHSLATAANDFLIASGAGQFVKKTLAETITIVRTSLDSVYSAIGHNHDASYSAIGHQHTSKDIIWMHANNATIAAGATMYLIPGFSGLTTQNGFYVPVAGTAWNLSFKTNSAQPGTGSLVCTVQIGFVNTTITCTVAAGAGASLVQDTAHSQAYAVNNIFCIAIKNNASAASAAITAVSLEYDIPTV